MKEFITSQEAQEIINSACDYWKQILAEKWAIEMVLGKNVDISLEFYRQMRQACTPAQHELFDEIFGKDLKEGMWVTITGTQDRFRDGTVTKKVVRISDDGWVVLEGEFSTNGKNHNSWNPSFLREATEEEITTVNKITPEIGKKYKLRYSGKFCHWFGGEGDIDSNELSLGTFTFLGNVEIRPNELRSIFMTIMPVCSYVMFNVGTEYIVEEVNN